MRLLDAVLGFNLGGSMSLKQWAKDNSNFIKLGDGESFSGIYMGYSMMMGQDGKEKPAFKFKNSTGNIQILQSQGMSLINAFDENEGVFKKGDTVTITRHGLKENTKYEVTAGTIPF